MNIEYLALFVSAILFSIGLFGILLNKRSLLLVLMCIEIMLLAVSFNFVALSRMLNTVDGHIFVLFILTVAAAESAIGLALIVLLFRKDKSIEVEDLDNLKG